MSKQDESQFQPYVSASTSMPEATFRAIILGVVLGIIFTAANAYLGLYIGMTVSASIPAAVISMAILRKVFRGGTVLENNIVQTVASSGESLAAGIIFTIPAFFIWHATRGDVMVPSITKIAYISLLGGALGILMMIPLRRMLIRDEHATLPYPEGAACANVLIAGEQGGANAKKVFAGVGIGALYKLGTGTGIWLENLDLHFRVPAKAFVGINSIPALLGVGYILGPRISAIMLAGGTLGTLVLVPIIAFFASGSTTPIFPATEELIRNMDGETIRLTYVRYIGAGAVTMGGILSLLKSLPTLLKSLSRGLSRVKAAAKSSERTDLDLPNWLVFWGAIGIGLLTWTLAPHTPIIIPLIVVFGFIFVMVASRIVGLVGSSSNPVSGMTIATLLGTTVLFVGLGIVGTIGMAAALLVGAVVCVAVCAAGDISQDLKTGYLLGATPWKQQVGEFIGVIAGASIVGAIVYLLGESYGFVYSAEHPNPLQAPQANLMAILIEGVMESKLQWDLIFFGMLLSVIVEFFGVTSLAFAVGLYLPVGLSVGIMTGGLLRWARERKQGVSDGNDPGVLYSSGLIAGEALLGIILALLATLHVAYDGAAGILGIAEVPVTIVLYCGLLYSLWHLSKRTVKA
ncbi:oligopeptide transporter, OPT family [bacterium]|nr:oligopeptide transporter, OPT family [bacterium]MBU1637973.1 oligopeptide transporter, OPT family [bacterium]MBU1920929.1 oligopeptide transporter, OPT family [bacterium]